MKRFIVEIINENTLGSNPIVTKVLKGDNLSSALMDNNIDLRLLVDVISVKRLPIEK